MTAPDEPRTPDGDAADAAADAAAAGGAGEAADGAGADTTSADAEPELHERIREIHETIIQQRRVEMTGFEHMIRSKWRIMYTNFLLGMTRGVGFFLGMTFIGGLLIGIGALVLDNVFSAMRDDWNTKKAVGWVFDKYREVKEVVEEEEGAGAGGTAGEEESAAAATDEAQDRLAESFEAWLEAVRAESDARARAGAAGDGGAPDEGGDEPGSDGPGDGEPADDDWGPRRMERPGR